MSIILTIYHIIGILMGLSAISGIFVKYLTMKIKEGWQDELTKTREAIELKREKEIDLLRSELKKESSPEAIKAKIRDFVDGEVKLMEQDIKQIKELSLDLKQILGTQQETLIAIQMSITELKPRIANLENRVSKLEDANGKK
jgi:hypothetical protein